MSYKGIFYPNLAAEMARKGIVNKDIAEVLGMSTEVTRKRLVGETPISISDAIKIRDVLFPTLMVDYLFDTTPRYYYINTFNFPFSKDNTKEMLDNYNNPDGCA